MIHTIIQILVYQLLFLAVYDFFLKKETFFNLNRAYLFLTPILSVLLPFISIGIIQRNIPQQYFVELPAIIVGGTTSGVGSSLIFWLTLFKNIWIIGMVTSGLILCFKIIKIIRLERSGSTENIEGIRFTILPKTDSAFSFFNTIYLGENISEENKQEIIAHEKVHIKQKHSLDLLFFELLRIVFWFNPLVYLYQNRIATLHEYIADAEMTIQKDKKQYYQSLLSEVFQTQQISFINTFFKESLIKNRIIMLQKSKSPRIKMMKYLLLFPILGGILIYTSCSDSMEESQTVEQVFTETRMPPPPPPAPPMPPPPPSNREFQEVPYDIIEQVPSYPGCSGDNETMKTCMSTKISEFVNENFNTAMADDLNLSGRQRIRVQFKIDETGKISDVRARAPKPELEAEAIRVIEMLPQMIPGEQKGEKVGVLYSLPIVFDVK